MFCTRKSNEKINRVHERALRILHNDYTTEFKDLLLIAGTETIHISNVKKVAIEMFKIKNGLSKQIISELFSEREFSGTRSGEVFQVPNHNTVFMGEMSLRVFGVKVWNELLPLEFKSIRNLNIFKDKIKQWVPVCNCRNCKPYIQNVGFTNCFS